MRNEFSMNVVSLKEAAWAAGFIEGEGSFTACLNNLKSKARSLRVTISQVQEWPLKEMKRIFGGSYSKRSGKGERQDYWQWAVSGMAALRCMKHVRPFMSPRRIEQMDEALRLWQDAAVYAKQPAPKLIYVIGRMADPSVPEVANALRANGFWVFDDWHSPGPQADEYWREYERARGRTFLEALNGAHAKSVFEFDRWYLDMADAVVCVGPAGRSAHIELGYSHANGKPCCMLEGSDPERFDVMTGFVHRATNLAEVRAWLNDVLNLT